VSQSGDPYEQEADWVANEVMRMQIPESNEAVAMRSLRDTIYRKCAVCEDEDLVQPKSMLQRSPDTGFQVASNLESRLSSSQGGGSPLPEEVRSFMEPRFGADFSQVRVHTGSEAVQMNRDLNAQAFTHKQDVYFGAGKAPGKDALTAHELTHVVQQTGAVQTKEALNQQNVQLKCAACEEEANVQRSLDISSVSEMGVQRSWFGDDDEKKEPESSSGGGVLDWAKDKVGGAVDSVSQAGGAAVDWAKEKGSSAVDTVTQAGGDAYDWVKQKGGAAVDTVTQAGGDAYDWAKQKGGEAVDTVTQAGSDAYDWAKQKGGEAVDVATDVGGQALDLMSNLGNVQVDWNSASGKILKAWASQLDPELVQNIRGKNPSDLYNLVDVPAQVQ
ncbi:MAG: eCIS core domain-containing protein, partial [Nostoc sp.]